MPRGSRTFSLRAHLLLLVVGTTLPALLIAAMLVRQVVADNRDAVQDRLRETARATASAVDAELGGTIRVLQALGQSDRLTTHEIPLFYERAKRLAETEPTWSAVSLSTLDGRQILNTARAAGDPGPELTDHESFDRAVRTRKPAIGTLRVGSITRQWGFLVRVPVIRDNQVVYVLSTWITASDFARAVLRSDAPSGNMRLGVVDSSGTVVARSPDSERFVGRRATAGFLQRYATPTDTVYRDESLDGVRIYSAISRAPVSGWVAGVAVPMELVDRPFRQSMVTLGIVAVLLLALGGGAAYGISRRMARDISNSAAAAERIAQGLVPATAKSNVTELQRLSDALARSATLLETRRRERDEQLQRADEARAQAEAADRAKDEFLALLGHELRNPLAPALTALHLMKIRGHQMTREREIVERQIRHMARLVDDLLDVARLRRGAVDLRRERFDLADAVGRAVEMTSPAFAEKQHQLDVQMQSGLVIDGDPVRVAQIVSNVLANAAKYTEPRGRVTLRTFEANGAAVIECRDNGIGMTPELRERAFELFVQGQQGLDRRQGGLGLGLAVARALVELHGGTIEATSAGAGLGSTFTIRLPLAPIGAMAPQPPAADDEAASPAQSARVMLVDDNRDALDTLLEALRASGLRTAGASNAAEALELALREHPDVAVLDIGLPDTTGFELARALRATSAGDAMRIIALTGYGREQDRHAARAAGFDAFLVKPVDVGTLIGTIRQLLGGTAEPGV